MTPIRWIIFAVVAVGALAGLVAISSRDKVDVSKIDAGNIIRDGVSADQVYGNRDAKIVLIEYGDFQCPGCGGAYPNLKEIKETYQNQIAFVFRHFPLTSIHPNALSAAAAAEAAGKQDKFWEMHDLLYENQKLWENVAPEQRGNTFEDYATQLGLDIEKFKTDMASKEVSDKINHDRALGSKVGVSGTPSVFIGNDKMSDALITDLVQKDGAVLKKIIDDRIKASGGTVPRQ